MAHVQLHRLTLVMIALPAARASRASPPQFRLWRAGSSLAPAHQTHPAADHAGEVTSWEGLPGWRASPVDERRQWGTKGPLAPASPPLDPSLATTSDDHAPAAWAGPPPLSLADCARRVLLTADPAAKAALSHAGWAAYKAGAIPVGVAAAPDRPSRPPLPALVPAREVPTLKRSGLALNVHCLHTLAHVELNAVDLAWDTVARFSPLRLPEQFYADFARVADDESRHLSWCLQRLRELGSCYGAMPAHDLLWQGCAASAGDVRARLAVVPMSQEARGLDAGQRLSERLVGFGDNASAALVARIAAEERAHVAVGVAWFTAICAAEGDADPGRTFAALVHAHAPDLLSGFFNHAARQEVGLRRDWYEEAEWPEGVRAVVVAGAAAGAAAAAGGLGAGGGALAAGELRRRLEGMLRAELQAAGG